MYVSYDVGAYIFDYCDGLSQGTTKDTLEVTKIEQKTSIKCCKLFIYRKV